MEVRAEEHCAEGEADGDLDVGGGEILSEHNYPARHFDRAGGATQEAAEEIFRMVHRFVENLPQDLRRSAAEIEVNRRQLVFPGLDSEYRVETAGDANAGRGLTIQNLHCSEVARWGRMRPEVLAALRAAVPPGGEIVLESTPNGVGGCFYREWQRAEETGYVRHFFPWWMDAGYRIEGRRGGGAAGRVAERGRTAADGELRAGREQIAFRRQVRTTSESELQKSTRKMRRPAFWPAAGGV